MAHPTAPLTPVADWRRCHRRFVASGLVLAAAVAAPATAAERRPVPAKAAFVAGESPSKLAKRVVPRGYTVIHRPVRVAFGGYRQAVYLAIRKRGSSRGYWGLLYGQTARRGPYSVAVLTRPLDPDRDDFAVRSVFTVNADADATRELVVLQSVTGTAVGVGTTTAYFAEVWDRSARTKLRRLTQVESALSGARTKADALARLRTVARGPTGLILAKSTGAIEVFNAATRSLATYPGSVTGLRVGLSGNRSGVVGDVANYGGGNTWQVVLFNAKTGADIRRIPIDRESAFPSSAVSVNADASRIAFSVNEPTSSTVATRIERTLVVDLASLRVAPLDNVTDPIYVGGELLVRAGTSVRVFDANLNDTGDLGVTVADRVGAVAGSSDGRYVAYERDEQIWVLDRTTRQTWQATTGVLRKFGPVFSPDGRHLAMLGGGNTAGVYVHVIPFTPGAQVSVTDSAIVESTGNARVAGSGRLAWVD